MVFSRRLKLLKYFFQNNLIPQLRSNYSTKNTTKIKTVDTEVCEKPLEIKEVDRFTKLKENEVRIQVQFCGVHHNSKIIDDKTKNEPIISPGFELSGEVVELGSNVQPDIALVGEKVAALNLSPKKTLSKECIVESKDVFRLPANVDTKKATVIIFSHSTALYAFSRLCKPPPKETSSLLISCGPVGLGLAALDVAAGIYKSKVIGVSDTEEHAELMRTRGAFAALTLNEKKLRERVLKRNNGQEIDIVYDTLGGDNLKNMMSCTKLGGTIISVRNQEEKIIKPPTNRFYSIVCLEHLREKNPDLYRQIVVDTLELADQGVLSPHISGEFTLQQINEAIKFIQEKKSFGKVLIQMDE